MLHGLKAADVGSDNLTGSGKGRRIAEYSTRKQSRREER